MKLESKKLIIGISVICALAVFIIIFIILSINKNKEPGAENQGTLAMTETVADNTETAALGDDSVDPENTDNTCENGAEISGSSLKRETGRSNGIDISKWQGKINWEEVKADGIEFAFIRIGYRGENGTIYKDSYADYNIQQAEKAGILIGVYFFSTAVTPEEAKEEASFTISQIEGYSISYPVVFDCEGFRNETSRMYTVTAAARTEIAITYMDIIKAAGYEPMLYGAKNELSATQYWDIAKIENTYKIWVAQYPAVTYPALDHPDYARSHDAWQYTNRGSVSGVEGNVDMVVCYFNCEKAAVKNAAATPKSAGAPQADEERQYTQANETVTAKELVNLRSAATTKSDIVASISNGETATRTGIGTNGWSRLQYNGSTVYAISSYLTTDLAPKADTTAQQGASNVSGNTFTQCADRVTAKNVVNLRALPTTDSEIIVALANGIFLERTGTSDKGWSRLLYEGREVYAVTSYLTTSTSDQESPSTDKATDATDDFTAADDKVTAKAETNLRTSPSTANSEIVYTLKNGEYIHRIGLSDKGWSKLEYNGQIVYAVSSFLTTEAAATETIAE